MQRNTTHLAIDPTMKKQQVLERVQAAKDFFYTPDYSGLKRDTLTPIFYYAEQNFTKMLARKDERYGMYNNILEHAVLLDDIHFLCYVKRELRKINEWGSYLKTNALPTVNEKLRIALAPTVARRQKFALSLCTGGFAMLLTRYAPAGTAFIAMGLICYLMSKQFAEYTLNNSLLIKENRLAGGVDHTHLIQDGMEDTFSRLESVGNNMLTASLGIFSGVTNQTARTAGPLQGQPQLVQAAAQPARAPIPARVQIIEDEEPAERRRPNI